MWNIPHKNSSDCQQMITWAQDLLTQEDWCVLDTETTGLSAQDEVIELAMLDPRGKILFHSRFKPTQEIAWGAARTHGIFREHLIAAPSYVDVFSEIQQALGSRRVLAYNAPFDQRLLGQTHRRYGLTELDPQIWIDVMIPYSQFCGEWNPQRGGYRWQKLPGGNHTAVADCQAVLAILEKMSSC